MRDVGDNDYYEDDEPIADVLAALKRTPKAQTSPPVNRYVQHSWMFTQVFVTSAPAPWRGAVSQVRTGVRRLTTVRAPTQHVPT
jgi:hypothetical protein